MLTLQICTINAKKQFTAIQFTVAVLIFSFCSISQVVGRWKQKTHDGKTSCQNKQASLFAKHMDFFNPF